MCTVFWLLSLTALCLIFMKPKWRYAFVVSAVLVLKGVEKKTCPKVVLQLMTNLASRVHCALSLKGFWTNPLVFAWGPPTST